MTSPVLAVVCLLLLETGVQGFGILPGKSLNHLEITEQAILNATVQTCLALAQNEGTNFIFPTLPLTAEAVTTACNTPQSSKTFRQAIAFIQLRNIRVDIRYALKPSFHFDDEKFVEGKRIIIKGITAVKALNKQGNYEAARQKLGEILHPLQDFYSHSNWVELGNTLPNSNLIRGDTSIGNIADESRATCSNCDEDICRNNILDDIIAENILTSGYFGILPFVSTKPEGKCSHGGALDLTSLIKPKGGINKDTFTSSHGYLHTQAANLAIAATSELLKDIRRAAGDRPFLEMMGISKGSSKALCFVIDSSSSMKDDIKTVKTVTSTIINSNVGTAEEPSVYILVPFNDPGYGPLIRTTNPTLFKDIVNSLTATGGGDDEENSLSGLQLALTSAPFSSEIFLFTDAPAKDKDLKSTVIALIERTQTVVNFMITDSIVTNRRRRSDQRQSTRIAASDAQLYRDLAQVSGGLAIEVTKVELPLATRIIAQSTSSSTVTLLQAARSPGLPSRFSFIIDQTVTNPTIYITGIPVPFTLTSPTGVSQVSTDPKGSLIIGIQLVGNLQTVKIQKQIGAWMIVMASPNPYTLKVIGQSSIDFVFDFVEPSRGPFSGFDALDSRPIAGVNGSLLVSLSGSNSAKLTQVTLVESSGLGETEGDIVLQESGNYLVNVAMMPSAEFVVRVTGILPSSVNFFQRQSDTTFRASNLTITADPDNILVPGTPLLVPFTLMTNGIGGNFTIRVTNNRQFDVIFPTILFVESGNSTNGTVILSAPLNTPSGTEVTLTIEAEAQEDGDINYIVLLISVLNPVTDFFLPGCQLLSLDNCSENCSQSEWKLSATATDGAEGAGVDRVSLLQGNGNLNTTLVPGNDNIKLVTYTASCCSPDVELLVVDQVGNVGTCVYRAAISVSTRVTLSPFLCLLGIVALGLHVLAELGCQ